MSKTYLRRYLKNLRKSVSPSQQKFLSQLLVNQLVKEVDFFPSTGVVAGFVPIDGEPDIFEVLLTLAKKGWTVLLPRVNQYKAPLSFVVYQDILHDEGAAFSRLSCLDLVGIPCPEGTDDGCQIDLCLMPCLGFTIKSGKGWRLGYGGGFYDRSAQRLFGACSVGIAWDNARVDFEVDSHDMPLSVVVTPSKVFK
jgi:5-formyltetrahydrofolate cyclo-ligase